VIRFFEDTGTMKLRADSFDDLYLLQRIITAGDVVEAKTHRRFKSYEGDVGTQKEVFARISVEKIELDKGALSLRFTGKIISGRPEKYVRIGSYHTITISPNDEFEVQKPQWKGYILERIREAALETRKQKLGVVALDDEKATIAYLRGYGIDVVAEIYSHLSKRMNEKEFAKQRSDYFNEIIGAINGMQTSHVVIAGPGFTKDDLKAYIEESNAKIEKNIIYAYASSAERSGIREALQDERIAKLFESEHLKHEFELLNKFLEGLRLNASFRGVEEVRRALESYEAAIVLVNDDMLNDQSVQRVLDVADAQKVKIEIFNSDDDAGMQLRSFGGISAIPKSLLRN
ncbi:MAG: mRNA surveillance protein pelota, partial [Candidatus Micrarchaeaceae archaeon]